MTPEQTKSRKSLYLKTTSLVTGLLVLVAGALWSLNGSINSGGLLVDLGLIALAILTIITARLSKFTAGVILGAIEVGFFALCFLGGSLFLVAGLGEKERCHIQMQSVSSLCQEYCKQNEGILPDADSWCDQLLESVENAENDSGTNPLLSYGYVGYNGEGVSPYAFNKKLDGYRLADVDRQTVLLFLYGFGWNQNGTSDILASNEHQVPTGYPRNGYYFLFVGPGSTFTVEFVKYSKIEDLNWEPAE